MNTSVMNLSGIAMCIIAIMMLLTAFMKGKKNEYKARRAAKKGL